MEEDETQADYDHYLKNLGRLYIIFLFIIAFAFLVVALA